MDSNSVDSLLREARRLALHAVRVGTLPRDSRIFEEIESMTQARARGELPSVSQLAAETQAVSDSAGVTIEQLKHRATPIGRLRHLATQATPFLIGFMTLLLTLYLGFQSSELHKADLALREYQDLVGERLQEKIYLAWKMYHYEHVLSVKGPPLAQLDGYQKLVDDSKRVYEKRAAVEQLLGYSSIIHYVPAAFEFHGPCLLQHLAQMLNSASPERPSRPCHGEDAPPGATASSVEKVLVLAGPVDCSEPHRPGPNGKLVSLDTKTDLVGYKLSVACFLQELQIKNDYDYPVGTLIYAAREKVNLLVSWLLPGLYGLLGACVFLMRDLLKGRSNARDDARIVDLLSLLLRVALGGLAGIIIGWFSVPTSSTTNSTAIAVSSLPFGMAFLAGFSIDSLFALLDRLPKAIGQGDEKKSAEASKGVEGKA